MKLSKFQRCTKLLWSFPGIAGTFKNLLINIFMESTSTFLSNCWPSLYVIGKTVWCRRRAEVARRTRVEVVRRDFWDRPGPHQLIDLPVRYFLNTSSKVRAKRMAGNDYKGVIVYALKMNHRLSWYCPKAYTCGLKDWDWLAVDITYFIGALDVCHVKLSDL